jgi:uroporphyrinogen III methyltransferase/synthase
VKAIRRPRIVITRSREGNEELAERLRAMRFEPISIDTLSFSPPADWSLVDESLRHIRDFDWLLFTSATGVRFFAERLQALDLQLPRNGKPRVAAVGEMTSRALLEKGIVVDFVPSRYLTKSLAEELPLGQGRKLLLFRADIADRALSAVLARRGFVVQDRTIYRTTYIQQEVGELKGADGAVFASSSAVRGFCSTVRDGELQQLRKKSTFCIGPVTARAAKEHGFQNIVVPKVHTFDALVEEIKRMSKDD